MTAALADCRGVFCNVAVFSAVVNLLMLAAPLYMLQVYDRVLTSHSIPTLLALSGLLCGAFALQTGMDLIRGRLVTRAARFLDEHLAAAAHLAIVRLCALGRTGATAEPVRDLDRIRTFLTGQGPIALVDLPWIPLFLLLCGLIHPWLGLLAFGGGVLLAGLTLLTEIATRSAAREANQNAQSRSRLAEEDRRNAETTAAMRMESHRSRRWRSLNTRYLTATERAADAVNLYAGLSKMVRMMLQSAALGLGAYLVIRQALMPGAMIASSIMMARALAPIETAIANWRGFVAARDSGRRLSRMLAETADPPSPTALPAPCGEFAVENVAVVAPGGSSAIVAGIGFTLNAGEAMGIIGRSGSGKTSLVRALVGVWQPARGSVRIDGAALEQWPPEILGPAVGYVAQAVDLFDGTVAENIARMATQPDDAAVVAAARAAGAHDMILRLPAGYDTLIGQGGEMLSAGQRQRVALARALYGDPFLIVLDEPNANLDSDGEAALLQAIDGAKRRGAVVILIAHRMGMLSVCDKLLVLADNAQQAFGPAAEVLRGLAPQQPAVATAKAGLKLVAAATEESVR